MTPIDTALPATRPDRRIFVAFPLAIPGFALLILWWAFGGDDSPQGPPMLQVPSGSLIAVEGDSLPYGLDPAGKGQPINGATPLRSARPWPEVLAHMLGASVTLENRGYPGDRLRDSVKRWSDRPIGHLTLAQFGLNDALNLSQAETGGLPLADFHEQMLAYVALRQSLGMQIMLIAPPPLADPALEATLAPYRATVMRVGKETGVIVIDTAAALQGVDQPVTPDGIHLTAAGNEALARAIAARLMVD